MIVPLFIEEEMEVYESEGICLRLHNSSHLLSTQCPLCVGH